MRFSTILHGIDYWRSSSSVCWRCPFCGLSGRFGWPAWGSLIVRCRCLHRWIAFEHLQFQIFAHCFKNSSKFQTKISFIVVCLCLLLYLQIVNTAGSYFLMIRKFKWADVAGLHGGMLRQALYSAFNQIFLDMYRVEVSIECMLQHWIKLTRKSKSPWSALETGTRDESIMCKKCRPERLLASCDYIVSPH